MHHIRILGLLCLTGCGYINQSMGLPDDNFFEEFAEKQIENQIGLDIDLTPFSPES